MASLKLAYSSATSLTVTNLHSLANSATAGWSSAAVDNTTDLYLDAIVQLVLDPANTAPGSDSKFYLFAYGYSESGDPCTTGATSGNSVGTQGALTFPSISSAVQSLNYRAIPYTAQDVVIKTPEYSICDILGLPFGALPPFWGIALLNFSGAALAASANTAKWRGVYLTNA